MPKVELPPKVEETTIIPFVGEVSLTPSIAYKQPDTVVLLEDTEGAEEQIPQPDAAKDNSTFSEPVTGLVSQMPPSYIYATRSSGESYYSNIVIKTLRVGGCPMSPSKRLAVVIPVRNTDDSPLSNKGKRAAEAAPNSLPILSDDEPSTAFARMTSTDREKLKQELFKGLRGASSGHVGYMSQLANEA